MPPAFVLACFFHTVSLGAPSDAKGLGLVLLNAEGGTLVLGSSFLRSQAEQAGALRRGLCCPPLWGQGGRWVVGLFQLRAWPSTWAPRQPFLLQCFGALAGSHPESGSVGLSALAQPSSKKGCRILLDL